MQITMNLKERGITIGDLLILTIIIITTTIVFKTFNKEKKTSFIISNHENITYKKNFLKSN